MSGRARRVAYRKHHIDPLQLFEYYQWMCYICGKQINKDIRLPDLGAATIDHIVPLSKGGQHEWNNVRPAHASCNYMKADKLLEEYNGYIRSHIV